ncbi:MAG: rod shape-determining protein MreC [Phycisphaerales bacterium JB054]
MARPAHQRTNADRLLPAALLLLAVISFLPYRWLRPNVWVGDLIVLVSAPVAQPLRAVGGWLAPARSGSAEPAEIAQLLRQVEEYKTLYLRALSRNDDLLRQMEQLRLMVELNPSVSTRLLYAPVIGAGSDPANAQLLIRAGSRQGVHVNDVVAVEGVQLFGAVIDAAHRTSWIRPITARSQGYIQGLVMIEDGRSVTCSLQPVGDGTLRGDAAYDPQDPDAATRIAVGQVVRLDDGEWPASAQMLVLGMVEAVEPAPDSPLRPVVIVRPTVALDRVTEVIVRVSEMPGDDASRQNGGTP